MVDIGELLEEDLDKFFNGELDKSSDICRIFSGIRDDLSPGFQCYLKAKENGNILEGNGEHNRIANEKTRLELIKKRSNKNG